MALPITFASQTAAQMSWLDDNFTALGDIDYVPGTVAGTNSIVFTQAASTPAINGYVQQQGFSFIATNTNTAAVTFVNGSLSVLQAYKPSDAGPVALSGGDIRQGGYYVFVYDSALNGNAGGFHVLGIVTVPNPSPTVRGGVLALASQTSQFVNAIATSGQAQTAQVMFSNLGGFLGLNQYPRTGTQAGQIMIGTSGSGFSLGSISAGTNIQITTGDGQITILATLAGGAVMGPAVSIPGSVASFSGTTGSFLHDTGIPFTALARTDAQQQFARAQRGASTTLSGNSVVVDFSLTNDFTLQATSGTSFLTAINALGDQSGVIFYQQSSSGNCQVRFPGSNWVFAGGTSNAPTATLTANARDWYGYQTQNSSLIYVTRIAADVKNT